MSKFEYAVESDGGKKIVEADEYRIEKNEKSGMYEHVFYKKGVVVLIIPHYLLSGSVRRVE